MKIWLKKKVGWSTAIFFVISFLLVYVIPPHWIGAIPGMNAMLKFVPNQLPGKEVHRRFHHA